MRAYTFSMLGLTLTTASATSLMWAAEPAMVLVMARVVLGEAITPALAAIVVAAAGGVMLVAGVLPGGEDSGTILGNSLVLAGVACCGVYTVLSRILVPAADALFIVAVQQTAGLAWAVALLGLDTGAGGVPALLALTGGQWLGASVSGLMYYAAAFWLYLIGLRRFPAGVAAGFLNLIPLFTIAAAFLVLDERLDWRQWLGAAVIVLSMLGLLSRLPRPGAAS
jgi:drug/metabolite transporter (DMT)-like permease